MEVRSLSTEEYEYARKSMLDSCATFTAALEGPKWFDPILHKDLCDHLQNNSQGNDKLNILPRSFLKTTIATCAYALWRAIKRKIEENYDLRCLIASNTAPNAGKSIRQIRAWVESHPVIQQFFPEVIPNFNKTRWSDDGASLCRSMDLPEATFESAGVGTNIIRRHYDLIIEDDTVAPSKDEMTGEEAMPTREDIEKAIGFHKLTIPLLIDFKSGERIVNGTRWAEYDLINYVLTNEKFNVFDRPAVNDKGEPNYFRYDAETLEKIRAGIGTYMYHMLYLNRPLSSEFMRFRPEWIQYFIEQPKGGMVRITVDPADPPTGKHTQDYSSIVVCLHNEQGVFVLSYKRGRITESQLINQTLDLAENFKAGVIWCETNRHPHYLQGFIDEIKRRDLYTSFEGIKVKGNKESRILMLSPIAENRRLHLRSGMRELEQELFSFPRGQHDDIIDALSLQLHGYKQENRIESPKLNEPTPIYPTFESLLEEVWEKRRSNVWVE